MSPEWFRRMEELYHAAREATPEGRAALLAQADPELRRDVESLLSESSGGEFQDRRAIRNAPELLDDATFTIRSNGFALAAEIFKVIRYSPGGSLWTSPG
jgi:hypothetical protein